MKTKLLRKVRKRYSIEYFPVRNCVEIVCHTEIDDFYLHKVDISKDVSKEEAYKKCHERLLLIILESYKEYGTRRNKSIKLWYNPSK